MAEYDYSDAGDGSGGVTDGVLVVRWCGLNCSSSNNCGKKWTVENSNCHRNERSGLGRDGSRVDSSLGQMNGGGGGGSGYEREMDGLAGGGVG